MPSTPPLGNRRQPTRRWLSALSLLLGAAALGGCSMHLHHGGGHDQPPDPANPLVHVVDGKLVVNQEPLRFKNSQGPVTITWRLPKGGEYHFAPAAIVLADLVTVDDMRKQPPASEVFECRPGALATEYTCLNRNAAGGRYKYTIAVRKGSQVIVLDPVVVNDWD